MPGRRDGRGLGSIGESPVVDPLSGRIGREAFEEGGAAEAVVETDETDSDRALSAPDKGGGKLKGIGGTQAVGGKEALSPSPDIFHRLDLIRVFEKMI
jgi:hypothetical protein